MALEEEESLSCVLQGEASKDDCDLHLSDEGENGGME
jgi:hypothetical protein